MSCINIYHPDYIKLLSEIDDSINPFELPTLIRLYQKMNNTDKIPSVSEIYEIDNRTKEGYTKVRLPLGDTSAKVEGHTTLEEFKKQKEDRIKQIQADVILPIGTSGSGKSTFIKSLPQENLVVIEPDAMRVEFTREEQINQKLQELINNKEIEENCKGKLKAEKGLATSFTKGGKWKVYEIFEGKSHKQGGIDINIKNNQISFTNKNGSIKAKYGLVVPKDN